ncbi:MAG TPA: HD domain-containing phosphohydrolase [Chthonomonadales bacterium]|nr:HD domain-containing phosphohydrolase [Chthonomonadales bacterium]
MKSIVIVDDHPVSRGALAALLRARDFDVREAADGCEALEIARAGRPDLIISDLLMPVMDGFELVRRLRAESDLAQTAILFYTADYDRADAVALAREAGVTQVLTKPAPCKVLYKAIEEALSLPPLQMRKPLSREFSARHKRLLTDMLSRKVSELEREVEERQRANSELVKAYDATIEGWARALDLRDHETEGHTRRVTEATVKLATRLGVSGPDLADIRRGALLHDIGKMGVPDEILRKPGPLTEAETARMRKHPEYAMQMLSPISFLRDALEIPYCHHERWDGTGYPRGLRRMEIPRSARIFAVVDVWDALRSERPYRAAWSDPEVRRHIGALSGSHFEPEVAATFLDLVDEIVDERTALPGTA